MTATPVTDSQKVQAFARQLVQHANGASLMLMIELGTRLGLFETMAVMPPATVAAIAEQAGLQERYLREWLGALVTGGVVEYDPDAGTYFLPPEHAACLTGNTLQNVGTLSGFFPLLGRVLPRVADAFEQGGGVPYSAYQPEFGALMDRRSRIRHDTTLLQRYLPAVEGLVERLQQGIRVADIGCGTGHAVNLMARAFPASRFDGFDFLPDLVEQGRAEAESMGLTNTRFEALDVRELPTAPGYDFITALDAIHDQVDPAGVLQRIRAALRPGGVFLMVDFKSSSRLEENLALPNAPFLYTVSTLHCMTVSLADGGAGLGAAWGRQLAEQVLRDAGFRQVRVLDVPDPMNFLYEARV